MVCCAKQSHSAVRKRVVSIHVSFAGLSKARPLLAVVSVGGTSIFDLIRFVFPCTSSFWARISISSQTNKPLLCGALFGRTNENDTRQRRYQRVRTSSRKFRAINRATLGTATANTTKVSETTQRRTLSGKADSKTKNTHNHNHNHNLNHNHDHNWNKV